MKILIISFFLLLASVFLFLKDDDVSDELIVEETKKVRLGNPMNGQTDMGPLISDIQLKRTLAKVENAKSEGARLLCGGKKSTDFQKGYFFRSGQTLPNKRKRTLCFSRLSRTTQA